jgi:hypothetical protein
VRIDHVEEEVRIDSGASRFAQQRRDGEGADGTVDQSHSVGPLTQIATPPHLRHCITECPLGAWRMLVTRRGRVDPCDFLMEDLLSHMKHAHPLADLIGPGDIASRCSRGVHAAH